MKQRFLICMALIVLLVTSLCGGAMAAEDPITVKMALSSNRFSGPAEVTVTILVTNSSDRDMPGALGLYDPSGALIEEFGSPVLSAGASKSWTGEWNVTREQLDQGRLTFAVVYPVITDDGMQVNKQKDFYATIVDAGAVARVEITRRITPSMARKGQEVSVTYEVANVGTIDVTNVVIKESSAVSKTEGKIASVKAGQKASYTFPVKMGTKNLISHSTVTYIANGSTYTENFDDATIKYGNVKLNATLEADKRGGNPGDTVKLTLTLKNTGKSDYQNVTVKDDALGTVFSGLTVPAGKTVTEVKEITIAGSAEYQFIVSGTDASGATVETATDRVPVTAVDANKVVTLEVQAFADSETIYTLPGIVTFTVNVSNISAVEAKDVTVSATGVTLYSFDSIQPGQTRSFMRDVRVETPGKFRFDAKVNDQLGVATTFESNIIQIVHSAPTATPSQVPIATPARPQLENLPSSDGLPPYVDTLQAGLSIAHWVFLGLGAVCLMLVIVGCVSRAARANKSKKAPDHLERDGYRDYTQAVPAKKRHVMPEEDQPADPPSARQKAAEQAAEAEAVQQEAAAEAAEDGSVMTEAMTELYPEATEQPAPEENVTYRRRRHSNDEA